MNFSAALPTATPPAAGLQQAAALGKSAPGLSGAGRNGNRDGSASSFGAVLSGQSGADAGGSASGRSAPSGAPSGGPTTPWSSRRSAFEARLGGAISGSGQAKLDATKPDATKPDAMKPDAATSGNDKSQGSTASLAASLGQAATPSRQGASPSPAGLALPVQGQPALATDAGAPTTDGSGKSHAKDAQAQDAGGNAGQAASLPSDPTLAPAMLAAPTAQLQAAQMQAAQIPAAQVPAVPSSSGDAQGGGSAPRLAGQASGAAANAAGALTGSPAQAADQPGVTPFTAAPATTQAAAMPALGTNYLPNPAIGAPLPPAAPTRNSDKGAIPSATTAKPGAPSATSTLSAILAAPGEGDTAGPLAGGSQGGQGMGGSLSDNGGNDKQQPFAQLTTVQVVGQETHAAPVMRLTPVQQLANSIVDAAGAPEDQPTALPQARAAAASTPAGAAARIKPLQVLNVTLDPPDLGSVSIKMRLTGQKLDLSIEVAQKDTVPLLGKEGDSLSNALQSSGYTVDNLTIKAASGAAVGSQHQHDLSQGQGQSQVQSQNQAQGQQSSSQFSAGSGQSGAAQGGDGRPSQRASTHGGAMDSGGSTQVGEDVVVQNSLSGDLYL